MFSLDLTTGTSSWHKPKVASQLGYFLVLTDHITLAQSWLLSITSMFHLELLSTFY